MEWIRESGLLTTPIAFTNTHSVGVVRDALVQAERISADKQQYWCMPVVLETFDGVLNDIWGQHVTPHMSTTHWQQRAAVTSTKAALAVEPA